ncbi:MAG: hypothetical protein LBN24_13770 [Mediterranea sp.]|nr:hypothetical protein [Mediterranea sp.]
MVRKVSASALPTVLVVSVLLLVILLMAFELWNVDTFYYIRYHAQKQQRLHLSSALTLYCNDSLAAEHLAAGIPHPLYADDGRSAVTLRSYPWGLYECVVVANVDSTAVAAHLLGKACDIPQRPALWVCDREHSLSLAGEATVEGEAYLPKSGLNYATFHQTAYSGPPLSTTQIHTSNKALPPIDSTEVQRMDALLSTAPSRSFDEGVPPRYHSFRREELRFVLPSAPDEAMYAKGRIILYADKITIPRTWQLSDVLLVARHVTIASGFSGSLQVVATDTVVVEQGAQMRFPSGVYLHGNQGKSYLHLCADTRLEGYAVVLGDVESSNGFVTDIHYRQDTGSSLAGLLYVDGTAHVEGHVDGAAYLKECYYLTGEEMYAGLFFNARFSRNDKEAFPFLFGGSGYERKIAKSVE